MSSRSEEDLCCPVCQDIFRDPVVLSCSHSFCKACLQGWWREKKGLECPYCKRRSSRSDPPRNLALKNLSEAFLLEKEKKASAGPDNICSLHSEKLKIFCLDHQQPVCVICRDAKAHNNHTFRPVDEAAQDHREALQKALKPVKEKLQLFNQARGNCDQTLKYIKVQAHQTEKQISEQFKKLHLFLQLEEKARVAALRKEEEQKSQMLKDKMQALSSQIAGLSDTIRATEKDLRAEDISFLLNYKAAVRRVQQRPLQDDPEPVSGALIDVVKHLGNLTFNIWKMMKPMVSYSPVILDPNTADPELVVSDDLSSVKSGETQQLPKNPERTRFHCSVLSAEGLKSGAHNWGVDVGTNKDWELGLLGEDMEVNGRPQSQLWRILFCNGTFTAFCSPGVEKELQLPEEMQRIKVHLDFDEGKLSFLDYDTNTHIHTFKHNFTDTLYPYMYTEKPQLLRILPVKVSVSVEDNC